MLRCFSLSSSSSSARLKSPGTPNACVTPTCVRRPACGGSRPTAHQQTLSVHDLRAHRVHCRLVKAVQPAACGAGRRRAQNAPVTRTAALTRQKPAQRHTLLVLVACRGGGCHGVPVCLWVTGGASRFCAVRHRLELARCEALHPSSNVCCWLCGGQAVQIECGQWWGMWWASAPGWVGHPGCASTALRPRSIRSESRNQRVATNAVH
jgi:hypothetical protein